MPTVKLKRATRVTLHFYEIGMHTVGANALKDILVALSLSP